MVAYSVMLKTCYGFSNEITRNEWQGNRFKNALQYF